MSSKFTEHLKRFGFDESGAISGWSLVWTMIFIVLGGFAVDVSNVLRTQAHLQATADVAVHAAVIELPDADAARSEAIRIAQLNMAPERHGDALVTTDIQIGTWTAEAGFSEGGAVPDAVRVLTSRTEEKSNPLPTYLLRFGIRDRWQVGAQSTAQRYDPPCTRDGLLARGTVEMSSNNDFYNGICVYGYESVKLSQNNTFEEGVIVGMFDLAMLQVPSDDIDSNVGLKDALRAGFTEPRLVDKIDELLVELLDPTSPDQPDYITGIRYNVKEKDFNPAALVAGNIYNVTCSGGNALKISGPTVISQVVIVTNCKVEFDADLVIGNAVVATSSTSNHSLTGSAGVSLGFPDNCTAGGGAQLITAGDVHFAAQMEYHGSQIVAAGDVTMAAQAGGIMGTSVQAGGDIKVTSNNAFGLCGGNVDQEFTANYWRLVN